MNKVGPYFNPQETYHYYSLPMCRPDKVNTGPRYVWAFSDTLVCLQVEARSLTLGEVLAGDRMAESMYRVGFKGKTLLILLIIAMLSPLSISSIESFDQKELCTVELGQDTLEQLKEAIEDLYYFEFVFG